MTGRPIRPAKGKLPPTDPIVHERARWKAERQEMQAALDAAHTRIEELGAALDRLVAERERIEHERDFWKERYDVQHRTVHLLEEQVAALREEIRSAHRDWTRPAMERLDALAAAAGRTPGEAEDAPAGAGAGEAEA